MAYRKKDHAAKKDSEDVEGQTTEHVVSPAKSKRTLVKPTVVGDEKGEYPGWANTVYAKAGYVPGLILFVVLTILVWPVLLSLIFTILSVLATQILVEIPGEMIEAMPRNLAPIELMFPIGLVMVVIGGILALVIWKILVAAARTTVTVAKGLFAGHGESALANLKRRRAEHKAGKGRAAEVKAQRAKIKAEKKKIKGQVSQAQADNPDL